MKQAQLLDRAQKWVDGDPDPGTAAEAQQLIQANDFAALEERFATSLEFGTAGLRGVLGAGTNRMNCAVVRRTTAGLARYLLKQVPDIAQRGVVVGRDGRRMSDVFAKEAAAVLAGAGIPAWVSVGVVPTPVTAFALARLNAGAAIMVTASHNPPEYNGYKVYWGNGAQIVPPHDVGIAEAIDAVEVAREVPMLAEVPARAQGLWKDLPSELEEAYLSAILALRPTRTEAPLNIVYTAMHGVGGRWAVEALRRAGFPNVHPVTAQQEPDGAFPTVRFPNPEEKGAMDLASALANEVGAELVLANDPDADRLAVMARDASGRLVMLTGNEVGVLLGHYLLTTVSATRPAVLTTIVSSAQLGAIAADLGARCELTLTGFKWIANRALELERLGHTIVFGYEEALGYTVGTAVRDKDGIGAAVVMAELAAWCRSRGTTLLGHLEAVQRRHGLFAARQFNATLPGASGAQTIRAVMEAFRVAPPPVIGAYAVESTCDYRAQTRVFEGVMTKLELPASNVLAWDLAGGGRVTLRPSGTEPKLKVYFELREGVTAGEDLVAARARASARLDDLEAAFLRLARDKGLP